MWSDFKKFAFKGNVIDLAVAVVLGAAFTSVVNAVVAGFIMPLVGEIVPGKSWQTWTLWKFHVGELIAALLNFLIVAFVLFLIVSKLIKALDRRKPEVVPPPVISDEVKLLSEIRDLLKTRA